MMGGEFPFTVEGDSAFQNTMEFIAIITALLHVVKMGIIGAHIRIIGDSISALTWAKKKQYKTGRSTKAAVVFAVLCHRYDLHIPEATHIAGTENVICDELFRGKAPESLGLLPDAICRHDEPMETSLQLVVPLKLLSGDLNELISYWNMVPYALDSFSV